MQSATHLQADDLAPMLEEAGRFIDSRAARLSRRPEAPASPEAIAGLCREAVELGLLPSPGQEPAFGLWEQPDSATGVAFTLGTLRRAGAVNAGIALAWHRMALATCVIRLTGLPCQPDENNPLALTAAVTGHHGIARSALARWIHQCASADDERLLADWLDRSSRETVLTAPPQWQALVWPVWRSGRIHWQLCTREQMTVTPCRAQHGLDELHSSLVCATPDAGTMVEGDSAAAQQILTLDAMGLVAIATGIADRGQSLAGEFAALRRQGGRTINGHPAVQTMLGIVRQVQWEASNTLNGFARPVAEIPLKEALMARQQLHPRLCLAANLVMQVHGGVGYMQDCGPEKMLRDQNMLKLQSGGIREIPLFIHAWPEA